MYKNVYAKREQRDMHVGSTFVFIPSQHIVLGNTVTYKKDSKIQWALKNSFKRFFITKNTRVAVAVLHLFLQELNKVISLNITLHY